MKAGILTMHKVLNCGSALQAYALQRKLGSLGCPSEIIDYRYEDKSRPRPSLKARLTAFFREALFGFPEARMKRKFKDFYRKHLILSPQTYDRERIAKEPPQYDLYIAGSDQVWNPRFIGDDTNFLLSFTPEGARRISYASSIAATALDGALKARYARCLSRFQALSVRERSAVALIRELTGREARLCCDPTLLVGKEEWNSLAAQSRYRISEPYILVYALSYMFDPFPEIYGIVEEVQKTLGMKVVFLQGRARDAFRAGSRLIKAAGPADFASLFQHAAFVITTSFHGVSFALIHDKPLVGVVDKGSEADSRLSSLLEAVGATDALYDYRDRPNLDRDALLRLKGDRKALQAWIQDSTCYLKENL